jgi:Zn-dependent protease
VTPSRQGSFRLFRALHVDVFLHWSWFLIAFWRISYPIVHYNSKAWAVAECLSLFAIVLLHEFGHALACRSVGGRADTIVLWPLGGVAYVDPPQRPGAMLWSIAAGPLVNVILFPVLFVIWLLVVRTHGGAANPDIIQYLTVLLYIDGALFCFNMLPIYPLDGGQILRSLLWYWLGRARSLMVASTIGFIAVGLFLLFVLFGRILFGIDASSFSWLIIMSLFVLANCWSGLRHARALARMEEAPRRPEFACPHCHTAPPVGNFWTCARCRKPFDIFASNSACPHCGAQYAQVRCAECGQFYSFQN